jgi:RHS repeat-associated protein
LDGNKNVVIAYLYGPESNSPSYVIKNGTTYKIIHDPALGSIRYVLNPYNSSIVQEIEYDELGNMVKNTDPTFQPLGFAGGLVDYEGSGLVRFFSRDYDPTVGRWTTKDPIGFNGGDTNLYNYAANNPMSYVDPSGLSTSVICRAVGGSGGRAGGMHCYLRITPEVGSSLGSNPITLILLTPDLKKGMKYINAPEDSGNGSYSAAVTNGKCNTSSGQDSIDKAIMASFNNQPNGTAYNPIPNAFQTGTNSNTFIHNVLRGAGLDVIPTVPTGAIGW